MKKSPLNYALLVVTILSILSGCFSSCTPEKQIDQITPDIVVNNKDSLNKAGIPVSPNQYHCETIEVNNKYEIDNTDNLKQLIFFNFLINCLILFIMLISILILILKKDLITLNLKV